MNFDLLAMRRIQNGSILRGLSVAAVLASISFLSTSCKTSGDLPSSETLSEGTNELLINNIKEPYAFERFAIWLNKLNSLLPQDIPIDQVVSNLIHKDRVRDHRIVLFHLQALGRIYKHDPSFTKSEQKFFRTLQRTFKALEDALGKHDQFAEILRTAVAAEQSGGDPGRSTSLKAKVAAAESDLKTLLIEEKWITSPAKSGFKNELNQPKVSTLLQKLASFPWRTYNIDRAGKIAGLRKQISKVVEAEYDFTRLEKDLVLDDGTKEDGDGLHEFRREMRWIGFEVSALNGMIQLDSQVCPIDSLKPMMKHPKAAEVRVSSSPLEVNRCSVSKCLLVGIIFAQTEIGFIKDKVESMEHTDDKVPDELAEAAIKVHQRVMASKMLGTLDSQLDQCL